MPGSSDTQETLMNIRPLHDRLLIEWRKEDATAPGDNFIPGSVRKFDPQQTQRT